MGTINGCGTKFFGKANYIENLEEKWEEFDTTLWFTLFWLPIVPLKSYRIRQKHWIFQEEDANIGFKDGFFGISQKIFYQIIKKYKLNWRQVMHTYLTFYGTIFAILLLLFVLMRRFQ
ncbi:MAG: hypothetical protein DRP84_10905 [Spirochaetes bacterium]|nr:MAG: hypothetical protein DRP84_10905 [Spirochaetota bacterium]